MIYEPSDRLLLGFLLKMVQEPKTAEEALRRLGKVEQELVHALVNRQKSVESQDIDAVKVPIEEEKSDRVAVECD